MTPLDKAQGAPAPRNNVVRLFALVCVAVTSGFVIAMSVWYTQLLAQPNWCNRAIGAAQDAPGVMRPEYVIGGCFSLLKQQVSALALNSHIALGVTALCLLVLIVIVVAGGHLSFKASKDGVSGDIGAEAPAQAAAAGAQIATDAAQATADQLAAEAAAQAATKAAATPAGKARPDEEMV